MGNINWKDLWQKVANGLTEVFYIDFEGEVTKVVSLEIEYSPVSYFHGQLRLSGQFEGVKHRSDFRICELHETEQDAIKSFLEEKLREKEKLLAKVNKCNELIASLQGRLQ